MGSAPPPRPHKSALARKFFSNRPLATTVLCCAVALACALLSLLLSLHRSQELFCLLWMLLVALDAALLPLTSRLLHCAEHETNAQWTPYATFALCAVFILPAFAVPGSTWASFVFVPAAVGLCALPLLSLSLGADAVYDFPDRSAWNRHGKLLCFHLATCALALALGVALLVNLYDYPYTPAAGWALGAGASALVLGCCMLCMLRAARCGVVVEHGEESPVTTLVAKELDQSESVELAMGRLGDKHGLTKREREVATYIATGDTRTHAAERLGISRDTVNSHIKNAYRKLGVTKQGELVALVVQELAE